MEYSRKDLIGVKSELNRILRRTLHYTYGRVSRMTSESLNSDRAIKFEKTWRNKPVSIASVYFFGNEGHLQNSRKITRYHVCIKVNDKSSCTRAKMAIAVFIYHFNNVISRLWSRRVLSENFNKNLVIMHN